MEGGFSIFFSPLSLIIHPPSLNLIFSPPSFIIYILTVFLPIFSLSLSLSVSRCLSPALGFHPQCSGPSRNRPVTMQAQLTASAHVAKIGRVFLQLNMGFKYRPLFLVHVF